MDSTLHCSAEYHLSKLKSKLAPLVYSLALRLSNTSNVFSVSLVTLAGYFSADYKTVWRAVHELIDVGFFDVISEEPFKHSIYRVIKHKQWSTDYPGHCCEKIAFNETDQLGTDLYAASGARVKFVPGLLKALRQTGLPDVDIVERWKRFLEVEMPLLTGSDAWRGATYRFLRLLRQYAKAALARISL